MIDSLDEEQRICPPSWSIAAVISSLVRVVVVYMRTRQVNRWNQQHGEDRCSDLESHSIQEMTNTRGGRGLKARACVDIQSYGREMAWR